MKMKAHKSKNSAKVLKKNLKDESQMMKKSQLLS